MRQFDTEEIEKMDITDEDSTEFINPKYDREKQTRKFFITQNNPERYGLGTPEDIKTLMQDVSYKYVCFCYESGVKNGTRHVHIYIDFGTPRGFKTPHNLFPHANIQAAKGSPCEIRDYIAKTGKHSGTEAAKLNERETFTELGNLDIGIGKARRRNEEILKDLKDGKSSLAIIEDRPELLFRERQIAELEEKLRYDKVPAYRPVEVIYICGETGVGKTKMIYDENEAEDICKITTYPRYGEIKFDAYSAHNILAFEEFRSQVDISDMLNYLDHYKIWLPARFADKVAAYQKVYITSNWMLDEQYKKVQIDSPSTWKAFIRRIDKVRVFKGIGKYDEFKVAVGDDGNLIYTQITGGEQLSWMDTITTINS